MSLISRTSLELLPNRYTLRTERGVTRIGERAMMRAAEVKGTVYVVQTAVRGAAEISICEDEMAKLTTPGARLRMAAISDAGVAALQARVLDLIDGL